MPPKTKLTTFRLTQGFLDRLDRHAKRLNRQHPGMSANRTTALRMLVEEGLALAEAAEEAEARRK